MIESDLQAVKDGKKALDYYRGESCGVIIRAVIHWSLRNNKRFEA